MKFTASPRSRALQCWRLCVAAFLILIVGQAARAQKCQDVQKTLDGLVAQRAALTEEFHQPGNTPSERSRLQQELGLLGPQISTAQRGLLECQRPAATGASGPVTPPAVPDCSAIQKTLDGLEAYRTEITKGLQQPGITPTDRSRLQQELRLVGEQISANQNALQQCQQAAPTGPGAPAAPPGGTAPQRILEIDFKNPAFDETKFKYDWGKEVATGTSDPTNTDTFPVQIGKEWVQVLAPSEDYDLSVVGATGWAIHPRPNTVDFPFDHPFKPDWETSLALDMNQNGAGPFTFLLSNGDKGTLDHPDQLEDESRAAARGLPTFLGLLGIEMDANLIPAQFTNSITEGNRLAVFGRWIIDAGHNNYRAEIHPPLLMAAAAPMGANGTRVLFTSRPFLVGHTYTVDTSQIYNDAAADDGTFFAHMIQEVAKVLGLSCTVPDVPCSKLVEAHVKVKSHPFQGVQLFHLLIRPPSQPKHLELTTSRLSVSFHFTVRAGCAVQVTSSATGTIDVFVVMNSAGYHPPLLPARSTHNYSRDELNNLDPGAGSDILDVQGVSDAVATLTGTVVKGVVVNEILGRGVQGDVYASLSNAVDMLSRSNAVENAPPNNIPANAGVTQDDNQPFPVSGWLEVKWVEPIIKQPAQPAPPPVKPVHPVEPGKP